MALGEAKASSVEPAVEPSPAERNVYAVEVKEPYAMNRIVHQLAGKRVALVAIVGQFRLDYSTQGPQRLVRLVEVCLHDGTPGLDDYWCVVTAGMQALHLLEGDRRSFEARVTLHGTPSQRRVGVSPFLQDRIVTLDRPTHLHTLPS
jgi:hypothetical protein